MNYNMCSCVETKVISPSQFYGRFVLGQFASGQGLTVANSLRRSLLSELSGTAIAFVYIEKASHEYESLPGLKECVLDVLLNLKQVSLTTALTDFSPVVASVHLKGPKVIRAKHLKLPFFIACVDPQQYIATLSEKGELKMKLLISCGKGPLNPQPYTPHYENCVNLIHRNQNVRQEHQVVLPEAANRARAIREKNQHHPNTDPDASEALFYGKKQKSNTKAKSRSKAPTPTGVRAQLNRQNDQDPAYGLPGQNLNDQAFPKDKPSLGGYFPVNNAYSPISKVNYTIESPDSGHEKVYLEIWTNGAMDPRYALDRAVQALIGLFLPLQQTRRLHLNGKEAHYIHLNEMQGALQLNQKTFQKFNQRVNQTTGLKPIKHQLNGLNAMLQFVEASKQQLNQAKHTLQKEKTDEAEMRRLNAFVASQRRKRAKAWQKRNRRKERPTFKLNKKTIAPRFFVSQAQLNGFAEKVLFNLRGKGLGHQTLFSVDLLNLDLTLATVLKLKHLNIHKVNQLMKPEIIFQAHYGFDKKTTTEITLALKTYIKQFIRDFKPKPTPQFKRDYLKFKEANNKKRKDAAKKQVKDASANNLKEPRDETETSKPTHLVPKFRVRRLYMKKLVQVLNDFSNA